MSFTANISDPSQYQTINPTVLAGLVYGVKTADPIIIKNKIIDGEYTFAISLPQNLLRFENCYFKENINWLVGTNSWLSFADCYFDKDLLFGAGNYLKAIYLERGHCNNLKLTGGVFEKIEVKGTVSTLQISGGEFKNLKVESKNIQHLVIHALKSQIRGFIHITQIVNNLMIAGTNENCNIEINKCEIGILSFRDLFANGLIKLTNVRAIERSEPTAFIIERADLGKCYFNLVNFGSFTVFSVVQSSMIDCMFTSNTWSEEILTSSFEEIATNTDPKPRFLQRKEIYRQLKYAMNKQGDYLQEMRFHILEMNAHYQSLNWRSNKFADKFILWTSRLFSNYGQRLFQPILWMLGIHLVLFWIWIALDKSDGMDLSLHYNSAALCKSVGEYTRLLNPVHKFDDHITGGFVVIDLLMRISGSYFLYLIIRASRKFIKSV